MSANRPKSGCEDKAEAAQTSPETDAGTTVPEGGAPSRARGDDGRSGQEGDGGEAGAQLPGARELPPAEVDALAPTNRERRSLFRNGLPRLRHCGRRALLGPGGS